MRYPGLHPGLSYCALAGLGQVFRLRVRHLTDGVILGSKDFVNEAPAGSVANFEVKSRSNYFFTLIRSQSQRKSRLPALSKPGQPE